MESQSVAQYNTLVYLAGHLLELSTNKQSSDLLSDDNILYKSPLINYLESFDLRSAWSHDVQAQYYDTVIAHLDSIAFDFGYFDEIGYIWNGVCSISSLETTLSELLAIIGKSSGKSFKTIKNTLVNHEESLVLKITCNEAYKDVRDLLISYDEYISSSNWESIIYLSIDNLDLTLLKFPWISSFELDTEYEAFINKDIVKKIKKIQKLY